MKRIKKMIAFLLAFTLTFSCMTGMVSAETGTKPVDGTTLEQPFAPKTGGSSQFRIPCVVTLNDGTIVAGCDARWTTILDGGGLDTIISRSKDFGATWNYTFANYLGDNGNVWNLRSTAFIDPALATDGENLYLIADLFPAGIALNGTMFPPLAGQNGLNEKGELRLAKMDSSWANAWDVKNLPTQQYTGTPLGAKRTDINNYSYTLVKNADGAESCYHIEDADGNTVPGYTIDAYFNIKGENVDTNLFFGDSPYQTWPTDYLYFTKSSDGGKTWSEPNLLNMKKPSEQTLLIGPGRGQVTSEGRIVFTAYEYTNGTEYSTAIYSDDEGKTWTRGASAPSPSSEAVVTEADGKLYMFTRHGGYYVSENWGESWSAKKTVGVAYNESTQLSAITYSEKIDGKTAILLSAPSNTSSRAAGRIFVGLVQEDGSIAWKYVYDVNGSDYYAYSCLTELSDGSIGLLYEKAIAQITYRRIAIEDIADGGTIGPVWLEDTQQEVVSRISLKPNAAFSFTVKGLEAGAAFTAVAEDPNVATVSVEGETVTVSAADGVTGLGETYVIVTAGNHSVAMKVYVTSAEQYEIVDLHMGETKTYTDKTNNYENQVNRDELDEGIAQVNVTGSSNTEQKALLSSSGATFEGKEISLEDCLYTFEATGTANTYTIGSSINGTTVYLSHRSGDIGIPNKTTSTPITVAKNGSDATFTLADNGSNLYFHKEAGGLYFDRYNAAHANCWFELYTKSDNAPEDSPIQGYVKVASLDEIVANGQYLIASQAADGKYYLLHPSVDGSNKYDQVAKVGEIPITEAQTKAKLATAVADFNGAEASLEDCLYTFGGTGTANTYTISGSASGTTVYLQTKRTSLGFPNGTTSAEIRVDQNGSSPAFSLYDTTNMSGVGGYLYFHKEAGGLCFDRNGGIHANCWFELYAKSDSAPADSPIPGYAKVTDLAAITAGEKYLIASQAADGKYYLVHPYNGGSNFNHVAKVVEVQPDLNGFTEIEFTGVSEGKTSVVVGNTTYYINVANEERHITLEVGESYNVPGEVQKTGDGAECVTTEVATEIAPYVAADAVESGKKYLIASGNHVMINEPSTRDNTGLGLKKADFEAGSHGEDLWLVTAVDGGYTIQDVDGKYLNFNGSSVLISDTLQTLTIAVRGGTAGNFAISNSAGNMYLNNNGGIGVNDDLVKGWSGNDQNWNLYQPSDGMKITGASEGNTVMTIGNINYVITVVPKAEPADYKVVDEAIAAANQVERANYTTKSLAELDKALNAVDRNKTEKEQDEVDAMAAAINNAIAALALKPADYTAVDNAIAEAEKLNAENYENFDTVTAAIEAVDRTKDITEQEAVNAMAQAITDAIAGLVPKEQSAADYSAVDAAITRANGLVSSDYTNYDAITAAINNVDRSKTQDQQAEVDAMAAAINEAIDALIPVSADYTAVDELLIQIEGLNKEHYKDFSAVDEAVEAVVRDKLKSEQTDVDAMATALREAIQHLEEKDADYSAVDAAISEARELNAKHYKNFSAVDTAVNAVVRGKKITAQAEVDAMAQAITNAVSALELKDADYSRLDKLLEKVAKLTKADYKDFSAVDAAVEAVVRDKKITEQAEVDAMEANIRNAVSKLELKEPDVKPADITQLQSVFKAYSTRENRNYTEESWNAFQNALKNAKAVLEMENPTPEQIAKALKALDDTEAALTAKTQKPDSGSSSGTSSSSGASTTGSNASSGSGTSSGSNAASSHNAPGTGDSAQTGLYVLLLVAAAAVLGVIFYKKKKDGQK